MTTTRTVTLGEIAKIASGGTPELLTREKSYVAMFGGVIHTYAIDQAVADGGAIVPLLYEGRMVELEQNQAAIDIWFERHAQGLTERQ